MANTLSIKRGAWVEFNFSDKLKVNGGVPLSEAVGGLAHKLPSGKFLGIYHPEGNEIVYVSKDGKLVEKRVPVEESITPVQSDGTNIRLPNMKTKEFELLKFHPSQLVDIKVVNKNDIKSVIEARNADKKK